MRVGRNIRAIRKRRGLTLEELSALCGVGRDDLGAYERGQATPRPGTVEKIAQALGVPIVAVSAGMGWTAQRPTERWEAGDGDPLHDGILETLAEAGDLALSEADIRALMDAVKASIPALVEHMKDVRPEREIDREILEELEPAPAGEEQGRYDLTDAQWERVRGLLPSERAGKGRAFKSNRLMLDGILYHMKSGTAWKELPERFGRHQCVSGRLRLWQRAGVWAPVLEELQALGVVGTAKGEAAE